MSHEHDQASSGLSPMPAPHVEEPQLRPGGVDAITDEKYGATPEAPTVPDPDPERNPGTAHDQVPEEITEPEETEEPQPDDGHAPEVESPA